MRFVAALVVVAAACGGDKKTIDAAVHDSPPPIDSPPPSVVTIACPGGQVPMVGATTTLPYAYTYTPDPLPTISVNGIVQFVMPSIHDVVPNTTMSDPGLHVGFSETKCLQFTKPGTFGFHCGPHLFTGSITVQ